MKALFARWLALPPMPDDYQGHQVRLLNAILLAALAYWGLVVAVDWVSGPLPANTLLRLEDSWALASALALYLLLRGQRLWWAGLAVTSLAFLWATSTTVALGSIRTPAAATYVFVIVIASVAFGQRGTVLALGASSLTIGALIWGETSGRMTGAGEAAAITQWLAYTGLLGTMAGLVSFAQQTAEAALQQARHEVDERKTVEARLREAEARWQFALEGSGTGVWDWNAQTNRVFFSDQWKAMLGYAPAEIGDTLTEWEQRVHPDDLTQCNLKLQRHFNGETPVYESEHRMRCKDGHYKWILDRGAIIERTPEGQPLRVVGTHTDITERRQAEDALRLQSAALENAANGIMITDTQGSIVWVNPAWCRLTGYAAGEALGQNPRLLKSGRQDPAVYTDLWNTVLAGEIWQGELINRRQDGSLYTEIQVITPVRDPKGTLTHFVAAKQDVTASRQASQLIQDSEEKYRTLFNNDLAAICIFDLETRQLLDVNDAYVRLYGYTRDELLNGMTIHAITAEHEAAEQATDQASQEGTIFIPLRWHRKKDGTVFPVEIVGGPYRWRGRPVMFAMALDITDRKQAEDALQESTAELQHAQALAHMGNWRLELERQEFTWSAEIYRIFGLAPGSPVTYATYQEFLHPDDRAAVEQAWRLVHNGIPFDLEHRIWVAGEVKWVRTQAQLEGEAGGQWNRSLGTIQDITERREIEEALRENVERFRSMFTKHAAVMLLIEPNSGDILDANLAAEEFYGYPVARLCQMTIDDINTLPRDDVRREREQALLESRNYFVFPHRLASGAVRMVEVHSSPILVNNQRILFSIIHDVTERQQAVRALRESENNFASFFDNVDDLLFVLDLQGNILKANATARARLDYSDADLIGQPILMVHPPERRAEAARIVADMLAGRCRECLVPVQTRTGRLIEVETRITHGTWNGQAALYGVTKDISTVKKSEEKFAKAFAMNATAMAISTVADGIYVDVNEAFCRSFGQTKTEIVGHSSVALELFPSEAERVRLATQLQREGRLRNIELQIKTRNGELRDGLFAAELIELNGQPHILTTFVDLTERKQMEASLRTALAEKEVLVKEVHHRVKNNLQVIISLLSLQAERIVDLPARAIFNDSRDRVRSMALVHEKLYQSPDLARINFGDYLRDLTHTLQHIYAQQSQVQVRVEVEPNIWFGVDTAIPCGLLANELISNAFKYAFPDQRRGALTVALAQSPTPPSGELRQFRLTVRDNGVGLPAEIDPAQTNTLGLKLVSILTRQINGRLTVVREAGVAFEITFIEKRERFL